MPRALLVALAAGLVLSCGLFPDLSQLDTATTDAGGSDVVDASSKPDAGPFCASSAHVFCADFDEGKLTTGWTSQAVDSPGTIVLATDMSVSAPGSFLATMPRRASTAPTMNATIEVKLDGWHRTLLEFDFYSKLPDWQSSDINSGIVSGGYYSDTTNSSFAVSMGQGDTTVGTPNDLFTAGAPIPSDAWLHARVDFDPSGNVDATLGPLHVAHTFVGTTPGTNAMMFITLGIEGYNQPAPLYRIYYDNVTIDFP